MNVREILALARRHVSNGAAMESSARLCLSDAIQAFENGHLDEAHASAVRSLRYSVGIFSPDYQRAAR